MKRIYWKHRKSGLTGHGEPAKENIAELHVARLSRFYPEYIHWTEPVEG